MIKTVLFYIKIVSVASLFISPLCTHAQENEKEFNSAYVKIDDFIEGTLVAPYADKEVPLVIFIMDAGSINRDGNDRMSKNNTFKNLSYELAKKGIATFRYDKRLFRMTHLGIKENEVSFDDYISDAKSVVTFFSQNDKYTKIIILGHGQGSLVGMIAAQENTDAFISVGGNGQSIDQIIIEQIGKQAPGLSKNVIQAFDELKKTGRATSYDPALESIFKLDLQPFIKSWMKYTPTEEISKLTIPILIIQGDRDIHVEPSESYKLRDAVPNAKYVIFEKMNHILKEINGNRLENQKSFDEEWREIMPTVIDTISDFVNQ
ncbi:alpha/beta hydrolase [Aquimarina hainanensis]|uniref:Alpha/beta hydrolase n=1 Tax=Aquimarina hainanensis TaxID=1578017 RepID=A0ABW5NAF3_9FLAO